MNIIKPYRRRIYYYETDKMGIVHHSNYIRIFEESRVSFLFQAGIPMKMIEAKGILIPVLSVECKYKSPLKFGDEFAVYPQITKFNGTTLELKYRIFNCENNIMCVEGHSSHCFTDINLKPIRTKLKYPDIYHILSNYNGYEITD